jgi:hypothetical protein
MTDQELDDLRKLREQEEEELKKRAGIGGSVPRCSECQMPLPSHLSGCSRA